MIKTLKQLSTRRITFDCGIPLTKERRKRNISKVLLGILFIFLISFNPVSSLAQQDQPEGAIYIVQEGDSLWDIALRFRISVEDLSRLNSITDPGQLSVGQRLLIPGLEGYSGELTTKTVTYGNSLRSFGRHYQIPEELLVRLNHLTSPADLYVGTPLVIPTDHSTLQSKRAMLYPGQSLLELAILNGTHPWHYIIKNNLNGTWSAMPGEVLHLDQQEPSEDNVEIPSALPEFIQQANLYPYPFMQGKVAEIKINSARDFKMSGSINEWNLNFFPFQDGYLSMQGMHAMIEPGLYPLEINGSLSDESQNSDTLFAFSQSVLIRRGNYPLDPPLTVSPETIDPAVTGPEDAIWSSLAAPITPDKLWEGLFVSPAPEPFSQCWPSTFGNRRAYNGSAYIYFHTGLDFCGGVGIEIHAPARGEVIFAGPLTVRGNATMINHGWGVYTGYMHQSEIFVQVGDVVEPGQVIGLVGGTGRVTGPHLHWEVWVGGVQVDPLDWLEKVFPE